MIETEYKQLSSLRESLIVRRAIFRIPNEAERTR